MKKNNSNYGWLFACVSLVILLGISVYLGISGWYFSSSNTQETDLQLGNNIEISVKKNESATASFTFSGGFLEGEKLSQIVGIKNLDTDSELYIRAKVYVFMSDNAIADMQFVTSNNWTKGDDGYYYFNEKLIPQGKIGLCSSLVIGDGSHLRGNKNYIMTIAVEGLDANADVEGLWGVNPLQNV